MISRLNWEKDYENELRRAVQARTEGNEGMARVCCRRAAGLVIGEYLRKRKMTVVNNSAYDRLAIIEGLPDIDENVKRVSRNFLVKVNQEHKLPENIDLIQDVTWLKEALLVSPGS